MINSANLLDEATSMLSASKLPAIKQGQQMLSTIVPQLLGSYWLHLGVVFPSVDVRSKFVYLGQNFTLCDAVCAENKWAITPDYVDVVLLQHMLDFCVNPQAVLEQATISLRPGGQLLILGFNPGSVLGVKRFFRADILSSARFLAPSIIKSWLNDFNLRVSATMFSSNHVFGDIYLLLAHKVNFAGKTKTVDKFNWVQQIAPKTSNASIKDHVRG